MKKKRRNAKTALFLSSFLFQSPSKPTLTLPAVWIWTLPNISILLVSVLQELAKCQATKKKNPTYSATKTPTKKQECGVDTVMNKFMHLPFLIKLAFCDLFYWNRTSKTFACTGVLTTKSFWEQKIFVLILPGLWAVRVATDLLKSWAAKYNSYSIKYPTWI